MEIATAGDEVDDVITANLHHVDATMLELLAKRMETAAQLPSQRGAVPGLNMLYARLATEVKQKRATPALKLLQKLLEAGSGEEGGKVDLVETMMQHFYGLEA